MKKFNVTVNGSKYEVEVEEVGGSFAPAAPVVPRLRLSGSSSQGGSRSGGCRQRRRC